MNTTGENEGSRSQAPAITREQYLHLVMWVISLGAHAEPGCYDDILRLVHLFRGAPSCSDGLTLDAMTFELHLQNEINANPAMAALVNSCAAPLDGDTIEDILASLIDATASFTDIDDVRDAVYSFAVDDEFWDQLALGLREARKAVSVATAAIKRSGGIQ